MTNSEYKCCICGETFTGWGNNPWPVVEDAEARCCNYCNEAKVIPARLERMFNKKKGALGIQ